MVAMELKLKQGERKFWASPQKICRTLCNSRFCAPTRRDSFYWFDNRLLLEAKVALYLKESLGTSTEVLALFTRALSNLKDEDVTSGSISDPSCPSLREASSQSRFVFLSEI